MAKRLSPERIARLRLATRLSGSEHHELLGHIDAIEAELETARSWAEKWRLMAEKNFNDFASTCVELQQTRNELAEAARIHVESEVTHAYRVKELEAKLAEAEKRAWEAERDDAEWRRVWTLRAEAAEARVRELEAAGFR